MTGDAKFGLLLGVAIVVATALVYYRPDAVRSRRDDSANSQVRSAPKAVRLSKMPHAIDAPSR